MRSLYSDGCPVYVGHSREKYVIVSEKPVVPAGSVKFLVCATSCPGWLPAQSTVTLGVHSKGAPDGNGSSLSGGRCALAGARTMSDTDHRSFSGVR